MDHGMGRACTETAHVRTGGVFITGYLSRCLGKIASAPLVHVPAGFLTAVDHIFHLIGIKVVLSFQFDQRDDIGCLGYQIFQHHMGRQVHIHIMGAFYHSHQLIPADVKPLGMLLGHKTLQLLPCPVILQKSFQLLLCEHSALLQLILNGLRKTMFQHHQLEHVTDVHDPVKFIFRKDTSKGSFFLWLFPFFVIVWKLCIPQFLVGGIPYVNLVWDIGKHILISPQVSRQFHQVIGIRVYNPLRCLCGAVI